MAFNHSPRGSFILLDKNRGMKKPEALPTFRPTLERLIKRYGEPRRVLNLYNGFIGPQQDSCVLYFKGLEHEVLIWTSKAQKFHAWGKTWTRAEIDPTYGTLDRLYPVPAPQPTETRALPVPVPATPVPATPVPATLAPWICTRIPQWNPAMQQYIP